MEYGAWIVLLHNVIQQGISMDLYTLKTLLSKLDTDSADLTVFRYQNEKTTTRSVRDDLPDTNQIQSTEGLMIEVLKDGMLASASTADFRPEALQKAWEIAFNRAQSLSKYRIFPFEVNFRPASKGRFQSPIQKSFSTLSPSDINEILHRCQSLLKRSPKIVKRESIARTVESENLIVSTHGAEVDQTFYLISADHIATAQEGSITQTRSDEGFLARSFQGGFEIFDESDLDSRIIRIAEQALELLSAEECPEETADLILMPDQMMLQIHESIGHPLEYDRILGDERNYAGFSFVKPEDFGTLQYGSEHLNVTFNPDIASEFASYAFDDAGNPANRTHLIQNGRLLQGLGGLESQARLGLPGVANMRAQSWNRPPIDRMANLNVEPGTFSIEDMIAATKRGVLMESNRSWSIDDFRRKFQFGCEYGRWIEDGKIVKTVRNPGYRGSSLSFWRSLAQVGGADTFRVRGTPYCGKGEPNQVIRVGHASPACRFQNVEIFGGAQ